MKAVTVNKAQLLTIVQGNRESHRARFEEALIGWQRTVTAELQAAVDDALAGRDYRVWFQLPKPEDHTDDYDDIIGMLSMHTEETIELETREYRRYVTDDWDWKHEFDRTYQAYTVG